MRNPLRRRTPEEKQRRATKRARKAQESGLKQFQIIPPEGVPLNLTLASISARAGAQLTDFLVTFMIAFLLILLVIFASGGSGTVITIAGALIFFFVRVPYYIVTELVWNGRTLAKRWMGLRVISLDGRSLTAHQVVVRNVLKEIEFFAPLTYLMVSGNNSILITLTALGWLVILFVVPWRSKKNQRIGDIVANTCVIDDPAPVLLRDMAADDPTRARERFVFTSDQLDHYGRFELQTLEQVLRVSQDVSQSSRKQQDKNIREITERIVAKIGYGERIEAADARDFLSAFYRAQRAHLESRKLFGDAREDKFFRADDVGQDSK
ncbi:RDD family protein [Pseudahrensia aquimaris]|uniref:RDD family protein n=1 Tax=Pseudahrensia aquimaris TaxID=744461 RepID=A0ABW3FFZ3_9HYPH